MVQKINRDIFSLGQKALPATKDDIQIARDLLETLIAHRKECVGMAANMIGKQKAIIVFESGFGTYMTMFNPTIIAKSGRYVAEEGCLSLDGVRKTERFRKIKVRFSDENFEEKIMEFTDRTAQIIQHEIDHTNGKII